MNEPRRWMQAHDRKHDMRRDAIDALLFLVTLFFVVAAMSLDGIA